MSEEVDQSRAAIEERPRLDESYAPTRPEHRMLN
jgi:hypothetical protein